MKAAVMGYGTVGKGVCEILTEKKETLPARCGGVSVGLGRVLDIRDLSQTPVSALWTTSFEDIERDPEIGVVVETMGGVRPAFEFCLRCLNAGKHVVTSNKQLVAEKGEELMEAARKNNVSFRFGASVGGGIPVIRTFFYGLAANEIRSFAGILNGTTNFILTKMIRENASFAGALKQAQDFGYAEKDPTADVEGHDACRKTAILASAAFGSHVRPEEIHTEGITAVTLEDVAYADDFGGKIKLLGRAERLEDGRIRALVSPAIVPDSSLISAVDGVFNAIRVTGDKVGEVMLYGQGAGKDATASAVVADVLDCLRMPGFDASYGWKKHGGVTVAPYDEKPIRLYVRGFASEAKSAAAEIRESFEGARFLSRAHAPENERAFVTGEAPEKELRAALAQLRGFVPASVIRIEA